MADGVIGSKGGGFKLTLGTASALAEGAVVSAVVYYALHTIHAEAIAHPGVIIALPFVAMAWVAFMIPLLMFCTYNADFKGLNPIIPTHYLHIARKAYRAFSNNNMRVREKDL